MHKGMHQSASQQPYGIIASALLLGECRAILAGRYRQSLVSARLCVRQSRGQLLATLGEGTLHRATRGNALPIQIEGTQSPYCWRGAVRSLYEVATYFGMVRFRAAERDI